MKRTLEITKEIDFHTGHLLDEHEGNCKNVHGHTYKLQATFEGTITTKQSFIDDNMVVDFGYLKQVLTDTVYNKFDHAFIKPRYCDENGSTQKVCNLFSELNMKIASLHEFGSSTAEAMIITMWTDITAELNLAKGAKLIKLRLWETPTSFVTYRG